MKVAGAQPRGIGEPQPPTEQGPPGGLAAAAAAGGRATAADARQAIGKRSGAARGEAAIARGGSPASEMAVERGLLWLARHQAADGSWSFMQPHCIDTFGNPGQRCECRGKGYIEGRTKASTAIALLPFLGAGNTHIDGPYKEVVYRGIEQLKASLDIELQELHADAPDFVPTFLGDLYGYGITSLVFAEAFGMTGDPDLERYVAALASFLTKHQHPLGGWRYEPGQPGDMTVTGWQVIALKSSQIAGVPIHSDVFRDVDRFLTSLAPPVPVARGQARLVTEPGPEPERDLTRYHYLASYANSTTREPNECTSAIGLLCHLLHQIGIELIQRHALGASNGHLIEFGGSPHIDNEWLGIAIEAALEFGWLNGHSPRSLCLCRIQGGSACQMTRVAGSKKRQLAVRPYPLGNIQRNGLALR
jgi:hypothetical protein